MGKRFDGEIIMLPEGGAVQYLAINGKEFLLVTGRGEDTYIPIAAIYSALESEWVYQSGKSERRIRNG